MSQFKSDIEIARAADMQPISDIAAKLNIPSDALTLYGNDKAKISLSWIAEQDSRPDGKLILVTAISPTAAGEGKTTTLIGLGDGLNKIGKKAMMCLREPSLGPCFGMKGGAAGGGYAQVVPMEEINLHFTGDFHAIGAANNLLAAMIDNHVYWGNSLDIDQRKISWRRGLDMNDRSLREVVTSLGSPVNGFVRQGGFDITVASEVMAVFCLADSLADLQGRLGEMVVAETRSGELVRAKDIKADGPMTVLLKDALAPNLVQTLENNPVFIHGGPFANIAHGCNSAIATKAALKLADYVVTEAGFGADLGAEKFLDIKCRKAGLRPDAVVLVATIKALKMHGGMDKNELATPNVKAVQDGCQNLARHIENIRKFGLPVLVAINRFHADTDAELAALQQFCNSLGVDAIEANHWADGSNGTEELAQKAVQLIEKGQADYRPLYADDLGLLAKVETIAKEIYRAGSVSIDAKTKAKLALWEQEGFGNLPVCIAKTQYSFSTDPTLIGAPTGHDLVVREVRLSAGAGFIVVVCGAVMTMPGLPRKPAAENIRLNQDGLVEGLF
ncbi:Formate--tetrahydrofolate ligase [hydrothermal vent metagenome]|uniref:formate--tetrahydrofolate ligase n=1 Tax=hydrothermal vent metagenome TaxID=652676 RepID=A0A3B0SQ87_9ZZZZ